MFIKKLSDEISEKTLSHWQVAEDGGWENARRVPMPLASGDLYELKKWLAHTSQDIAIEAFFRSQNDGFFFFGMRVEVMPKDEQISFLERLISSVSNNSSFEQFMHMLSEKLGVLCLLHSYPDFIELGAEGFWKSYGSYVVWQKDRQELASVAKIQEGAPQILKVFERPMIMEFAWLDPVPMWLGIPVSEASGRGGYQFSADRYEKLSKTFC